MHPVVKKVLMWLVIAFAVYAVVTQPARAADIVLAAWDVVSTAVVNLFRFFGALLR